MNDQNHVYDESPEAKPRLSLKGKICMFELWTVSLHFVGNDKTANPNGLGLVSKAYVKLLAQLESDNDTLFETALSFIMESTLDIDSVRIRALVPKQLDDRVIPFDQYMEQLTRDLVDCGFQLEWLEP